MSLARDWATVSFGALPVAYNAGLKRRREQTTETTWNPWRVETSAR